MGKVVLRKKLPNIKSFCNFILKPSQYKVTVSALLSLTQILITLVQAVIILPLMSVRFEGVYTYRGSK
jgi:hypothetical protein